MFVSSSSSSNVNMYSLSQPAIQKIDLTFPEDDDIGESDLTLVYEHDDFPGKVFKFLKDDSIDGREKLKKECDAFNKYYGEGAARLLESNNNLYLEMDHKSGKPLDEVYFLPASAEQAFLDVLNEMQQKGMFCSELEMNNFLFCYKTEKFFPVGLNDLYEVKLHASPEDALKMEADFTRKMSTMLEHINSNMTEVVDLREPPALSQRIGSGAYSDVYLLKDDETRVCKKFTHLSSAPDANQLAMAKAETANFNRFYGPGSAELLKHNNTLYLIMLKVPGVELTRLGADTLPPEAESAYYQLLNDLADAKIMHNDFSSDNVTYDRETNRFYPIDMGNVYYKYFSASDAMKEEANLMQEDAHQLMLDDIRARTFNPAGNNDAQDSFAEN